MRSFIYFIIINFFFSIYYYYLSSYYSTSSFLEMNMKKIGSSTPLQIPVVWCDCKFVDFS